jgi:hypothetical protein
LELIIHEKLTFVYIYDKERIIEDIEKNIKKIDKLKTKEDKITFILDMTKDYPYPDFRKNEFLSRLEKKNLRTVNEN